MDGRKIYVDERGERDGLILISWLNSFQDSLLWKITKVNLNRYKPFIYKD
jgi:hypothetical protein